MSLNLPEETPLDFPDLVILRNEDSSDQAIKSLVEDAELTADQRGELENLLRAYADRLSDKSGRTTVIIHDTELTTSQPIRSEPYRVSPRERSLMEVEIKRMLDLDMIEACESDYTSPLISVVGKNHVLVSIIGG